MRRHGLWRMALVPALAVAVGCLSTSREGRPVGTPRIVDVVPAVPEAVAEQRVRYVSSNLLPGDTSFELPVGEYRVVPQTGRRLGAIEGPRSAAARPTPTLAVHGNRALRLPGPPIGGRWAILWPEVRLPAGPERIYTLSAYLRRSGTSARIAFRPHWPERPEDERESALTERWRRYHLSFEMPEHSTEGGMTRIRPAIVVATDARRPGGGRAGQSWVEVDAVQLAAGPAPALYRPRNAVDYGAVVTGLSAGGCLRPGKPISLRGVIRNNTGELLHLQIIWQLTEVVSEARRLRALPVVLGPGRGRDIRLDFGQAMAGYYTLRTDVRGGIDLGVSDRTELAVIDHGTPAVASRPSSLPSRPDAKPRLPCALRRLSWRWRDLETMPGLDDVTRVDRDVDVALAGGAQPVVCLSGPLPADAPAWAIRPTDDSRRVDPRQYRQFVLRLVSYFRGRVVYWQLPRFPDDPRLDLARQFRQTVLLADPGAKLVGPGRVTAARSQRSAIEAFITRGGSDAVDVLLHSLWRPEDARSDASWVRLDDDLSKAALACVAVDRPVLPRWEVTPAWSWPTSMGLAARAAHIHRVALLLAEHGVDRWLMPDPPGITETPRRRCAIEVAALATVAKRLGAARFVGHRTIGSGVLAMRFAGPGGSFAALVCPTFGASSRPVSVVVPLGVRAESLFGRVLADGAWPTEVSLSLPPVYIQPTTNQDDWLDGVSIAPPGR